MRNKKKREGKTKKEKTPPKKKDLFETGEWFWQIWRGEWQKMQNPINEEFISSLESSATSLTQIFLVNCWYFSLFFFKNLN